jgi:hypothetical protein
VQRWSLELFFPQTSLSLQSQLLQLPLKKNLKGLITSLLSLDNNWYLPEEIDSMILLRDSKLAQP